MVERLQLEQTLEFRDWLVSLRDREAKNRIGARLRRLEQGLFGQSRALGEGLEELKLDFGPGYRIYFARRGSKLVVFLCGGDKGSQSRDIVRARSLLQSWENP